MKRYVLSALIFFALACPALVPALAQEAPPPHKMPRVPVHRESIQDHKVATPAREVQGQAIVVDGEKLRIGDFDLRLFGVVPPQLSASFGPQARAALDELTVGQTITCTIRDRDREERFLATCHNANNADLGLELLRRGLAVTARGSVASTDLAAAYVAAEQAAAAQKVGLWSVAIPPAASLPDAPKTDVTAVAPPAQPAPQAHDKTTEEKPAPAAAKSEQKQVSAVAGSEIKSSATSSAATPAVGSSMTSLPAGYAVSALPSDPGFLARYQLLVTGLVMLITALGLFSAVTIQRLRDKRAEMQAIAAALRGELMAAHAVCRARLRSSVNVEDKDITWPRLRSTLYQAYVGRLGWLGAELARRIASIYGQASDYAAYFSGDDELRMVTLPKRQALQALVQHIDDVLPRLAIIEHTGNPSSTGVAPPRPVAVVVPLSPHSAPALPSSSFVAQEQQVAGRASETVSLASILPSPIRMWSAVQKMARQAPWGRKKAVESRDPIAEYTALIEEEMKRFSFVEEEDESEQQISTDTTTNGWASPKAHEAF